MEADMASKVRYRKCPECGFGRSLTYEAGRGGWYKKCLKCGHKAYANTKAEVERLYFEPIKKDTTAEPKKNVAVKQKTVERVIKDFGLFDYDDDKAENVEKSPKMFRNKSVLKRLNRIIDISEKRKRAIETRWKSKKNNESNEYKCNTNECDNDTNEVQTEYKSNTPIIKEKEIKGGLKYDEKKTFN